MKKKLVINDLKSTHSHLKTEQYQYNKYGQYLRQEIDEVLVANEKLLSCLKDRYQIYQNLAKDGEKFDRSIAKKIKELNKKLDIKDKISIFADSPNRRETISPVLQKSKLRLKEVKNNLYMSQNDPIAELVLLTDHRNNLETENQKLRKEVTDLNQTMESLNLSKEQESFFNDKIKEIQAMSNKISDAKKERSLLSQSLTRTECLASTLNVGEIGPPQNVTNPSICADDLSSSFHVKPVLNSKRHGISRSNIENVENEEHAQQLLKQKALDDAFLELLKRKKNNILYQNEDIYDGNDPNSGNINNKKQKPIVQNQILYKPGQKQNQRFQKSQKEKNDQVGDLSGATVLKLLEIHPNSNATISELSELCSSEYFERKRHLSEVEAAKLRTLFEALAQQEMAQQEKRRLEQLEKEKKEKERIEKEKEELERLEKEKAKKERLKKEKEEKERLKREKEEKERLEREKEEASKNMHAKSKHSGDGYSYESGTSLDPMRKRKKKGDHRDSFSGPLVIHSNAEPYESENEDNDKYIYVVQRPVQTKETIKTLKADLISAELKNIQNYERLTNEIGEKEDKLSEIEADILNLVKEVDLIELRRNSITRKLKRYKMPTINVKPTKQKSLADAEVNFKSFHNIDSILQRIDMNSSRTSTKMLYLQEKTELEQVLANLKVTHKMLNADNIKKQTEYKELLEKLRIIDPYKYNTMMNIEPPVTNVDQSLLDLRNNRLETMRRINTRLEILQNKEKDINKQISDARYVIKSLKQQLYIDAKSPRPKVNVMCSKIRNNRISMDTLLQKIKLKNIETQFYTRMVNNLNASYDQASLDNLNGQVTSLEEELTQLKIKYNTLQGKTRSRRYILTNQKELNMFQNKISERKTEIESSRMRMCGLVTKIFKQMKRVKQTSIDLPEPPPVWKYAVEFVKKVTKKKNYKVIVS